MPTSSGTTPPTVADGRSSSPDAATPTCSRLGRDRGRARTLRRPRRRARRRWRTGSTGGGRRPSTSGRRAEPATPPCFASTSSDVRDGAARSDRAPRDPRSGSPSSWSEATSRPPCTSASGAREDPPWRSRRPDAPLQPRRQRAVAEDRAARRCDSSPREITHLADTIDSRFRHFVLLAAYSGMRVGEIAGLTWERVDLLRRQVDVVQSLVEVNGAIVVNPPKTRAGHRRVPIPRVVAESLAASAAPNPAPTDWVVPSPEGAALRVPVFRSRRSGLPQCGARASTAFGSTICDTPRCPFGSRRGASPNEIAARAGHRSVVTVLDRYGHLFPDRRDDVTDELDRMAAS